MLMASWNISEFREQGWERKWRLRVFKYFLETPSNHPTSSVTQAMKETSATLTSSGSPEPSSMPGRK
jgi:hypothetical protein